jgi:hypothetical protein
VELRQVVYIYTSSRYSPCVLDIGSKSDTGKEESTNMGKNPNPDSDLAALLKIRGMLLGSTLVGNPYPLNVGFSDCSVALFLWDLCINFFANNHSHVSALVVVPTFWVGMHSLVNIIV